MPAHVRKVALITGSGKKRLGWHMADALAQRHYALALHYHTSKDEAQQTQEHFQAQGVEVHLFQADLADEDQCIQLVRDVRRLLGRVDVFTHCAGIWPRKPLEETSAADVRRCFEVNTLSTFVCAQQVGLLMAEQPEGGCIITLGDWAAARPYRHYAAYFVSKGAIPTITRCLAIELAARNPKVRVNCIEPGPVMIPDDVPQEERQRAVAATLVKHEGNPANVAQAALYLIDNDFVTGTCLTVDGGRTIFSPDE